MSVNMSKLIRLYRGWKHKLPHLG